MPVVYIVARVVRELPCLLPFGITDSEFLDGLQNLPLHDSRFVHENDEHSPLTALVRLARLQTLVLQADITPPVSALEPLISSMLDTTVNPRTFGLAIMVACPTLRQPSIESVRIVVRRRELDHAPAAENQSETSRCNLRASRLQTR